MSERAGGPAGEGGTIGRRLTDWVRWAAAPLGFLVFVVGLTVFGLRHDGRTALEATPPAGGSGATIPTPVPTTSGAPATTPAPGVPPPPAPAEAPVASATAIEPAPADARASSPTTAARFGPVCGQVPGRTVQIVINGRPAPPVTADARGCVTVVR
jgi:hypothetical protein